MSTTENWTAADIPDQSGRVVIVTGANSGIGLETTRELVRRGAHVVLACRNRAKAEQALADVNADLIGVSAEIVDLDLASSSSVHAFARWFHDRHSRLDLLINNAGIMLVPQGTTEDGFERQVGTNHLGHFALTGLLLEPLLETDGSRVVTVSSLAHRNGSIDFDNLLYEHGGYHRAAAYARSKLANLLFTYELQRRLTRAGAGTLSLAAHPGVSATNLADHLFERWYARPFRRLVSGMFQSSAMGALPTLRAAVDPDAVGGQYYGPDGTGEQRGHPVVVDSTAASKDEETAARLWDRSVELTGVDYHVLGR